ncbi:MAG: hypothetical protein O8C58_01635 [Candidatus Methanoperedens sp.]|nr:hypothetical protein [Candidatus Methanoperedens sp.]
MNGSDSTKAEIDLKLKAKMTHMGELTYTLQASPSNIEWKYSEPESEYTLMDYKFKADALRQIVRNVSFKHKELMVDSIRSGSKEFLFELQVPKRVDKEKLKQMFTQIANEIKNEIAKSRSELESFNKFLEDSEF